MNVNSIYAREKPRVLDISIMYIIYTNYHIYIWEWYFSTKI